MGYIISECMAIYMRCKFVHSDTEYANTTVIRRVPMLTVLGVHKLMTFAPTV